MKLVYRKLSGVIACFFLFTSSSFSMDKIELKTYLGSNTNYTMGSISGEEYFGRHSTEPQGIWKAKLRHMPDSSLTGGIELSYFFNRYLGLGFGIQQTSMVFPGQTIKLTDTTGGNKDHYFPEYSLYGPAIHVGPTLRIQPKAERFSRLTYYAGLHATYFFGTMTGTDYNVESLEAYTGAGNRFQQSQYGKSGRSYFNAFGYMPKLGVSYSLNKRLAIGTEWRLTYWTSVIAGGMRSFSDGFANDDPISFQSFLVSCTYRFGNY